MHQGVILPSEGNQMLALHNSYVYLHERLDTNLPFYVGKGTNNRATSKKDRNQYWHNIVNKAGFKSVIIQDGLTRQQALNAEKFVISLFKKFFKLANLTDGGDGGNGLKGELHPLYGKPRTQECKDKISNSLIGKSFLHCANRKGTVQTNETKNKISIALKGKKKSLEHIKNASEAFKNSIKLNGIKKSPMSDETKLKISLAQKGKKLSEEHKAKLRKPKMKRGI